MCIQIQWHTLHTTYNVSHYIVSFILLYCNFHLSFNHCIFTLLCVLYVFILLYQSSLCLLHFNKLLQQLEALGQCIPPLRHVLPVPPSGESIWMNVRYPFSVSPNIDESRKQSLYPDVDPDRHQNLIFYSLAHCQPSLKISYKSVWKFLRKIANKQTKTDRQTNNDDYISSLAEVIKQLRNYLTKVRPTKNEQNYTAYNRIIN